MSTIYLKFQLENCVSPACGCTNCINDLHLFNTAFHGGITEMA